MTRHTTQHHTTQKKNKNQTNRQKKNRVTKRKLTVNFLFASLVVNQYASTASTITITKAMTKVTTENSANSGVLTLKRRASDTPI